MITHFVLSGGGVKGIAIVGAICVLNKHNILDNVHTYIGSSIGGLISFLLTIGYTDKELYEILFHLDMREFRNIDFSHFLDKMGLDDGTLLLSLVKSIIKQKEISADITFKELYEKTNKTLVLTGSSLLSDKRKEYYSHKETPKMPVLDALRITISYPGLYTPITSEKKFRIDGGLFNPYPMCYLDDIKSENKLGIMLVCENNRDKIENIEDYIFSIVNGCLIEYENIYREKYKNETIFVSIPEIYSMNFDITQDNKQFMYEKGIKITQTYLKNQSKKQSTQ